MVPKYILHSVDQTLKWLLSSYSNHYMGVNPGLKRRVLFSCWIRDCPVDLMKLQKPNLHGAQEGQMLLPMEMLAVQLPMHQAEAIF